MTPTSAFAFVMDFFTILRPNLIIWAPIIKARMASTMRIPKESAFSGRVSKNFSKTDACFVTCCHSSSSVAVRKIPVIVFISVQPFLLSVFFSGLICRTKLQNTYGQRSQCNGYGVGPVVPFLLYRSLGALVYHAAAAEFLCIRI